MYKTLQLTMAGKEAVSTVAAALLTTLFRHHFFVRPLVQETLISTNYFAKRPVQNLCRAFSAAPRPIE